MKLQMKCQLVTTHSVLYNLRASFTSKQLPYEQNFFMAKKSFNVESLGTGGGNVYIQHVLIRKFKLYCHIIKPGGTPVLRTGLIYGFKKGEKKVTFSCSCEHTTNTL